MQYTAYISNHCPNCRRFMESVQASKSAQAQVRLVDIDTLTASQRDLLSVVPTVQSTDGNVYTGSKAFELLKAYEGDIELQSWVSGGSGSALVFSDFASGDGVPKKMGFYEEFTPIE